MGNVAHMQDQIRPQHLFQGGAESRDQLGRQIRDEPHRVGQDHIRPVRQFHRAHGRIKRGKQHVLGHHLGPGQVIEQG